MLLATAARAQKQLKAHSKTKHKKSASQAKNHPEQPAQEAAQADADTKLVANSGVNKQPHATQANTNTHTTAQEEPEAGLSSTMPAEAKNTAANKKQKAPDKKSSKNM